MSKLAACLMAALTVAAAVAVPAAQAQSRGGPGGPPGPRRGLPCGAPLNGEAPAIMTYDRSSGTQVFVGGRGETEVSAYNRDTGASAALRGDLSRPGVAESCANDPRSGDSYGVTSDGPGQLTLSGRDGATRARYGAEHAAGETTTWDFGRENRCFKSGIGIFTPAGNVGIAVATPPGAIGVGLAAGDRFAGVGVGANHNFAGVGLVGC